MDSMTDAAMPPGFDPRTRMVPPPWLLPWGPWLQVTQSAFDAWMGLWTAALPQHPSELVLQVQRQALDAWTAPLAWAAPPAEPQAQPTPRPPLPAIATGGPVEAPPPWTVAPATPEPKRHDWKMPAPAAEATASAERIGAARPEPAPPRARKAAKPAPELRQPGARKTLRPPRHPRPKTRR